MRWLYCARTSPNLHFVAAGGTREPYFRQLRQQAEALGLQDCITWTGWLDERDFVSYIESADICLCPHLKTEHTDTTFPNKVYLYNLFAKPVVTSSCRPLARYMQESGGGVVFGAGDAEDLANRILALYRDAAYRKHLGEAGKKAVLQRYNWPATAKDLIHLYDGLTGNRRKIDAQEMTPARFYT